MSLATERLADAIARGDHDAVTYWRAVLATADAAPPLTEDQRAIVRVLLTGRPSGKGVLAT